MHDAQILRAAQRWAHGLSVEELLLVCSQELAEVGRTIAKAIGVPEDQREYAATLIGQFANRASAGDVPFFLLRRELGYANP